MRLPDHAEGPDGGPARDGYDEDEAAEFGFYSFDIDEGEPDLAELDAIEDDEDELDRDEHDGCSEWS